MADASSSVAAGSAPPASEKSVVEISIPEQKEKDGRPFPLVLSPADGSDVTTPDAFVEWARANADEIDEKVRLHGAVLFRGFPAESPEVFARFIEDGLEIENMPYVGGAAVRTNVVGDRVFTANESPPSEPIPFHHEMAQVPSPPVTLLFYCEVPPTEGGETPILLSHRVLDRLREKHPDFVDAMESKGVRYVRTMPEEDDPTSAIGRSWKSTFLTDTRAGAEEKMAAAGTQWQWLPDGNLRTTTAVVPAVRENPRTGKKVYFNSMVAAYTGWVDSRNNPTKAVVLGDGTPVDHSAMMDTVEIMKDELVAFKWQKGDILFIDNRAAMHSRFPFKPPRRILASIGASCVKGRK